MNLSQLTDRVYSLTRDFNASVFRKVDIVSYLNEGIDRLVQVIPEFDYIPYLVNDTDEPLLLPKQYHSLLAQFATARCFSQDDRPFQGITFSNEFEQKLSELRTSFESGLVSLFDENGDVIQPFMLKNYVEDDYYYKKSVLFRTPEQVGGFTNNTTSFDGLSDEDDSDDLSDFPSSDDDEFDVDGGDF